MKKIFNDDFPEIATNDALQDLIREYPHFDPGYINVAASFMNKKRRALIEQMWQEFAPYADYNFEHKVSVCGEFLGRCWEMMVACTFLRQGYCLQNSRTKKEEKGPDICINLGTSKLWIEAVTCTQGTGADAVPDLVYGGCQVLPMDQLTLRFGNAVVGKYKKYSAYLNDDYVSPNDLFIIAVSKGAVSFPDAYPSAALRFSYGVGDLTITKSFDPKTLEEKSTDSFFKKQTSVAKQRGAHVPTAFFDDPAHACVSAIIYCDNNILNHPEPLGSDFILLRNHNATNPLPENFLDIGAEWKVGETLNFKDKGFINRSDAFDF